MLSCIGEHWCCVDHGRGSQDNLPGMEGEDSAGAKERGGKFLCSLKAFLVTWVCHRGIHCPPSLLHIQTVILSFTCPSTVPLGFLPPSCLHWQELGPGSYYSFLGNCKGHLAAQCPQPSRVGSVP